MPWRKEEEGEEEKGGQGGVLVLGSVGKCV